VRGCCLGDLSLQEFLLFEIYPNALRVPSAPPPHINVASLVGQNPFKCILILPKQEYKSI